MGLYVSFVGREVVKMIFQNPLITELHCTLTEAKFTCANLITFQNKVTSKGSVTSVNV